MNGGYAAHNVSAGYCNNAVVHGLIGNSDGSMEGDADVTMSVRRGVVLIFSLCIID